MWERTLQDLVRGLRANKKDEARFIALVVDEIRKEIKSKDMELKAGAVLKLTYLEMLGHDMSWASFHVVEVMSSSKFHLKSVGYLAATQSFDQDTDVLMLTTNLLKKDLNAPPADVAVTLNGISNIITPDLARDLSPELMAMMNHSRANIRKRAVVAMYKVILQYPECTERAMSRLREKLEDSDPAVIAATVNVLCELARRNPSNYLLLAPQLFHLMTTSTNNWMLIKIIKLFGFLSPHEPRLVKKLQSPITELISTTPAISLLYECVHTCIIGGMLQTASGDTLARMCVTKLAAFLQDSDQNLKYIALLAMTKIVPTHPHLVAEYQDVILASVNDQDISIRMRALDLLSAMVNRSNLQSMVQQLLLHLVSATFPSSLPTAAQSLTQNMAPASSDATTPSLMPSQSPAYRLALSQRILNMCSQSTYDNVTNFEWYLSVLVDLAHVANVDIGAQVRDQLVDVVGRVKAARRSAVKLMYTLLSDTNMLRNAREEGSCAEVLWAAAWICAEYCSELAEPQKLIPEILQPEMSNLDPETIAVYIHAATKVFGHWAAELAERWDDDDLPQVKGLVDLILTRVGDFVGSPHVDVQERAANTFQLFTLINADLKSFQPKPEYPDGGGSSFDPLGSTQPRYPKSLYLIQPLFSAYELNPVALHAQENIPVPDGLDLEAWIIPPPRDVIVPPEEANGATTGAKVKKSKRDKEKPSKGKTKSGKHKKLVDEPIDSLLVPVPDEHTPEDIAETERRRAERLERMLDDPYYIVDTQKPQRPPHDDVESIPIVRLDDMPPLPKELNDPHLPSLKEIPDDAPLQPFVVEKDGEMPNIITPKTVNATRSIVSHLSEQNSRPTSRASSLLAQELAKDQDSRPSTPDAIKVVRSKKKGATRKQKARVDELNAP